MTAGSGIAIEGVSKVYPGDVLAVDDVSLSVQPGEFLVLVGPSGCGKTTLLRMIAGLERTTSGTIAVGGTDVTHRSPAERDIAMVFQNYALYPHMTVRRNLAYGLRARRTPRDVERRRVAEVARMLTLTDLLDRKPAQLSGGQRQRVAMGRAIVREPSAFLMDEPLSNLDATLRARTRTQLAALHERLGVTTVLVTHDQVEAMTLGQRVAVMRDGRIQQIDRPQELYERPATLFVAAFIGAPRMNLIAADLAGDTLSFADVSIRLPADCRPVGDPDRVVVGVRAEHLSLRPDDAPADGPELRGTVTVAEELGADTHVLFPVDVPPVETGLDGGSDADDAVLDDPRTYVTARVAPDPSLRPGRRLRFALDPRRFHYFDPDSGASLRAGAEQPAAAGVDPAI